MVYDNMKVAVAKFVGHNEKQPTKGLLTLSTYYGFNFRFLIYVHEMKKVMLKEVLNMWE